MAQVVIGSPDRFTPTPWRHGCDDFAAHEWRLVTLPVGREQEFAYGLLKRDRPHYLPMINTEVERRGRRVRALRFAFPGYAFAAAIEGVDWPDLKRFKYDLRYIWDQATIVSDLNKLDALARANASAQPVDVLERGDQVRIRSGPYEGRIGTYCRLGRDHTLVLEIHTLGAAFPVSVQGRDVEKVA